MIATVILSKSPVLRNRSSAMEQVVDNDHLLLMAGDEVLHENLKKARMTTSDLKGKLREANVIHLGQVRAVVMDSTGDISVLHADSNGPNLDIGCSPAFVTSGVCAVSRTFGPASSWGIGAPGAA